MSAARPSAALCLTALLAAPSLAQRADLASLFPSQAAIEAPVAGRLVRLDLPAEVLAACRADLSDLRVFDAAGHEVPFVIESGVASTAPLMSVTVAPAEILEAARETRERDDAPAQLRETYVLAAPPAAPPGTGWELWLTAGDADFVSRIEARVAQESADAPSLSTTDAALATGSVFRLRDVGAEKLGLPLPVGAAVPRLLVTLETEGPRFLEPSFHYESRHRIEGGAEIEVPLEVRSRSAERGATVVVLDRPAGLVPARLRLTTATPFFRRSVEVWDEGAGARADVLGRARLFRIQAAATVQGIEVPLAPARGEALRVVIDDGDSPPLDELVLTASLPRPALLFALPGEGGPAAATLRFGGGRAFRPRYDVAALPPPLPAIGEDADVAEILRDDAPATRASLGPIVANPAYDPQPALAWARRPGAAIDPRLWSHRRALEVRPSPEGLSRLRLGVEDLGVARPDLADLRILDGEERQWAYLLERGAEGETLPLAVEGPQSRDGASRWTLEPPAAPATADQVSLDVPVPYFDRPFELIARLEDQERTIASGRLQRAAGDPRPVLVTFPAARFDRLELRVTDGDDAPLDLAGVEARFPVPEVFFAAPDGSYSLLVGQPEANAPSYELERVRDVVLAVRAAGAEAGPLEPNTAFSAGARLASGEGWQRALLWAAIVLLVGFLTVLTLRLARSGGPSV